MVHGFMRFIYFAVVAAVLIAASPAQAQCNGQFQPGQVCGNSSGSQAIPHGTSISSFGGWFNNKISKTSNYTAASLDCWSTFDLGGSTYFTLTINAASGYTTNCAFVVSNNDTGRAKLISVNGVTPFRLYPSQAVIIFQNGSSWQLDPPAQRWKLTGTTTVFAQFATGSDGTANDCLADGAAACKTVQAAYNRIANDFDTAGQTVQIICCTSSNDTTGLGIFAQWTGGGQISINGPGGSPPAFGITTVGPAINVSASLPAVLTVQNLLLTTSSTANGFALWMNAPGLVQANNINFGASGVNHMFADLFGAAIQCSGSNWITGNAIEHFAAVTGGNVTCANFREIIPSPVTFTFFAYSDTLSQVFVPSEKFCSNAPPAACSAPSVTGQRYFVQNNAVINGTTGDPNYFPGTIAGPSPPPNGGLYQ